MEIIGEFLGKIFSGLGELFVSLLGGLFQAFKPVFIVAIIVVAVYVGKGIYHSNKRKRDEQKYIVAMRARYTNMSKSELVEICEFLTNMENCRNKAAKKNANARSRDEQMSAIISDMAVTMFEEQLVEKYPFIEYEYRHHDITYLKSLI